MVNLRKNNQIELHKRVQNAAWMTNPLPRSVWTTWNVFAPASFIAAFSIL